jgi:hypothetical protein
MILSTADATVDYPMSAEVAMAIFAAWAVATFALGLVATRRRDV